ncbi:MAG: class I SAM-dependent methyltransferase [Cyclobacteriaceae bacterium]|nr:class I SAM-dependent methyltransferase [Cyclobacteriaceae bacterium]
MENVLDSHVRAYQGNNLYDFDNEIILRWYPHRIILRLPEAKSMLELGLGHGITTNIFANHFERYVVLDGSRAVIDNFRASHPKFNSEIIETFFEDFETDEKFDVVNLGFILEHIDNPNQILTKFRKYLKRGGRMFVSVPNAEVLNRRLGNLAGLLPEMTVLSENDLLLGHKRYYTLFSFKKELTDANYTVDRIEGIYLKPFTTQQMLSLNFGTPIIDALCKVAVDYPELSCAMLAEIH